MDAIISVTHVHTNKWVVVHVVMYPYCLFFSQLLLLLAYYFIHFIHSLHDAGYGELTDVHIFVVARLCAEFVYVFYSYFIP
jgi:hypothetical protein